MRYWVCLSVRPFLNFRLFHHVFVSRHITSFFLIISCILCHIASFHINILCHFASYHVILRHNKFPLSEWNFVTSKLGMHFHNFRSHFYNFHWHNYQFKTFHNQFITFHNQFISFQTNSKPFITNFYLFKSLDF